MVKVNDCVKVPEKEWDNMHPSWREPYVEEIRKDGFVYAIRANDCAERPDQGGYQ